MITHQFVLSDAFNYCSDFLERIIQMTDKTSWRDVIASLHHLWGSEVALDKDIIWNTPLWCNNLLQIPR